MSLPMFPSGSEVPQPVDAEAMQRERELNEARGIIREVHGYCARRCPISHRCPGMECRQYRREQAAKDVIARSVEVPERVYGPAGVVMGVEE